MSEPQGKLEASIPSTKELKKAQILPRRDLSPLLKLLDNPDRVKLIKQGAEAVRLPTKLDHPHKLIHIPTESIQARLFIRKHF